MAGSLYSFLQFQISVAVPIHTCWPLISYFTSVIMTVQMMHLLRSWPSACVHQAFTSESPSPPPHAPAVLLALSTYVCSRHSPLSPPLLPLPHTPALAPLSGSTGVRIPAAPLPHDQNFRSKALMNLFPSPLHALAAHPPAFSARADTAAKPKVRGLCMGGWHRHGEGGNLMRGGWVLLRRGLLYAGLRSSTQGRGSVGCVSQ